MFHSARLLSVPFLCVSILKAISKVQQKVSGFWDEDYLCSPIYAQENQCLEDDVLQMFTIEPRQPTTFRSWQVSQAILWKVCLRKVANNGKLKLVLYGTMSKNADIYTCGSFQPLIPKNILAHPQASPPPPSTNQTTSHLIAPTLVRNTPVL